MYIAAAPSIAVHHQLHVKALPKEYSQTKRQLIIFMEWCKLGKKKSELFIGAWLNDIWKIYGKQEGSEGGRPR